MLVICSRLSLIFLRFLKFSNLFCLRNYITISIPFQYFLTHLDAKSIKSIMLLALNNHNLKMRLRRTLKKSFGISVPQRPRCKKSISTERMSPWNFHGIRRTFNYVAYFFGELYRDTWDTSWLDAHVSKKGIACHWYYCLIHFPFSEIFYYNGITLRGITIT